MNRSDRILGWLIWISATAIIAGIVHIVSILAMPRLAPNDAFARLASMAPPHTLTFVADSQKGQSVLPFEDPATVIAVCRFDLAEGPMRMRGKVSGGAPVLLSFRNRLGTVFYSMNDRAATRGELDIVVATPQQLRQIEADDPEDDLPTELRLPSPTREGFVLLRALATEPGKFPLAVASVKAISCASERLPTS